jgi:urease beta subunit
VTPGEIRSPEHTVFLAPGRQRRAIRVTSTSARPIRVSSHYPFWRVNPRLQFDRVAAEGFRLDLPAGASIRWEPGQSREVSLVALHTDPPGAPSAPDPGGDPSAPDPGSDR